jgi:two-component system, cell cycle response regulator
MEEHRSHDTIDEEIDTRVDSGTPLASKPTRIVGATISVLGGSESGRLHYIPEAGGIFGRGEEVDFVFADATISREHVRIEMREGHFYLRDLKSMNGTFVDDQRVWDEVRLPTSCRIRLGRRTVFQFSAVAELGAQAFTKLCQAMYVDALTGTGNRSYLEQRLREEVSFAWRHREPVGLLMLDLDHFKAVNDRYGHVIGDQVLRDMGAIMRHTVRTEDSVYRYGGEEFCVLVRGESPEGLERMAQRLRTAIGNYKLPTELGDVSVTVSVGVATVSRPDSEMETTLGAAGSSDGEAEQDELLVLMADRALYRAKEQGRDCVVFYEE